MRRNQQLKGVVKKVTTTSMFGMTLPFGNSKYYGTALAIKYTNTAAPNTPLSTSSTSIYKEVDKAKESIMGGGLLGLGIGGL
jgi:hypothetical protein